MLDVDVAVNNRLPNVEEEEHGDNREREPGPVARDTDIQLAVPLQGRKRMVEPMRRRLRGERGLFPQAQDVLVDGALEVWFDLLSLDHLDDLLLLLVDGTVFGTDLAQALVDVVVETFTHLYNYRK